MFYVFVISTKIDICRRRTIRFAKEGEVYYRENLHNAICKNNWRFDA